MKFLGIFFVLAGLSFVSTDAFAGGYCKCDCSGNYCVLVAVYPDGGEADLDKTNYGLGQCNLQKAYNKTCIAFGPRGGARRAPRTYESNEFPVDGTSCYCNAQQGAYAVYSEKDFRLLDSNRSQGYTAQGCANAARSNPGCR